MSKISFIFTNDADFAFVLNCIPAPEVHESLLYGHIFSQAGYADYAACHTDAGGADGGCYSIACDVVVNKANYLY